MKEAAEEGVLEREEDTDATIRPKQLTRGCQESWRGQREEDTQGGTIADTAFATCGVVVLLVVVLLVVVLLVVLVVLGTGAAVPVAVEIVGSSSGAMLLLVDSAAATSGYDWGTEFGRALPASTEFDSVSVRFRRSRPKLARLGQA